MVKRFKQDIFSVTFTHVAITSSDLAKMIEFKLVQQDSRQLIVTMFNKRIKVREQGDKIVKLIMWSKDLISAAASVEPHAAIAWAGVSLLLPLVLNNSEQKHDMLAGLEQISNLILLYKFREDLYLTGSLPLAPALEDFEYRVTGLYDKILEYQIRAYLHLRHQTFTRGVRNLVKWDDWSGLLSAILTLDSLCVKFTDLIDVEKEQTYMSSQSTHSRMQIDIEKSILDGIAAITRSQREQSNNKCLQALSSDYKGQKNLIPERVPRTCEWFLNDKRFLDWRDKKSSALLWISADPGCGKSVLAKCLVDEHLLSNSTNTSRICYFFFKDGQDSCNESHHALSALLHCLFSPKPADDLIKHAESSYAIHGEKLPGMFSELWSILMQVVADPSAGEIVCLIDALDECRGESRHVFLEALIHFYENERISSNVDTRLKFIITSRLYSDIHDEFARLAQASTYIHCSGEDETEQISQEIDLVIAARVPRQLARLKAAEQQQIIVHLCEIKGRTYLWLHLILDLLQRTISTNNTVERLHKAMESLPRTVYNTYAALLKKSSDPEQARVLLQIITAARRPLTLRELRLAWEVSRDQAERCTRYEDLADVLVEDPNFPTDLRNLCGLLISIYDGQVHLLHLTVREFLVGDSAKAVSQNEVQFDIGEAEQLMTRICTKYLGFAEFVRLELPDYIIPWRPGSTYSNRITTLHADYVFLQYAAAHWHIHLGKTQSQTGNLDMNIALDLVSAGTDRCRLWLLEWCIREGLDNYIWFPWPDLTIAGAVGAQILVIALLREGLDDDQAGSALWAAANWSHMTIVDLLLAAGVDIDSQNDQGKTALHGAVKSHDEMIVRLLLHNGADPNIRDRDELSPLSISVRNGNEILTRLLLENGADTNTRVHRFEGSPVAFAAKNGHNGTVTVLLDKGADLHGRHFPGNSPIAFAAQYGHESVVRLLLERGADLHTPNEKGNSPLALAADGGHQSVVKHLIDQGAYLDTRNNEGDSPVALAAKRGYESVVKLLIDRGAEFDTRNNEGNSPVALAAAQGHDVVVKLLLDRGANLHTRNKEGDGVVALAATRGFGNVVKLLVNRGAILDTRNNEDYRPVGLAVRHGHESVVELLLDLGSEVNARDDKGESLITLAVSRGNESMVNLLLRNGADVRTYNDNVKKMLEEAILVPYDNIVELLLDGGLEPDDALLLATFYGRKTILRLLLERGADSNLQSTSKYGGGSALVIAAERGNEEMVQLLLKHNADVQLRNDEGVSALEMATVYGNELIVKLLLEKGADFGLALCIAASMGTESILEMLLDRGADINVRNDEGLSALEIATAEGNKNIVKILLEKGRPDHGNALLLAASSGNFHILKLLVDKDADIHIRNDDGYGALDMATEKGHDKIVKLLLEKGADVTAVGPRGSVIELATFTGYTNIAELLVARGADPDEWPGKQLRAMFGE